MGTVNELKDLQKLKYKEMMDSRIPELVRNSSCNSDDGEFSLSCQVFPVDYTNIVSRNGTDFYPVRALCSITNNITNEIVSFNVDLLNIPVFYELGFKIRGNYMQMLDRYERVSGWSFSIDYRKMKEPPVVTAVALGEYGKTFTFYYDKQKIPYVLFKVRDKSKNKRIETKVPVNVFFRAITSMSSQELLSKFGRTNPFVTASFVTQPGEEELSAADCVDIVAEAMLGKTRANSLSTTRLKIREIRNNLFKKAYMNLGSANIRRFEHSQSFKRRAVNKVLASPITVNKERFSAGTIITTEIAEKLDASPITALKVKSDGKIFNLQKFSVLTFRCLGAVLDENIEELNLRKGTILGLSELEKLNASLKETLSIKWDKHAPSVAVTRRCSAESLTLDDLFTAFAIWMDNLNGLNVFDEPFELSNRVCIPYDDRICKHVSDRMDALTSSVLGLAGKYGTDNTLLAALSALKLNDSRDIFIDEIRDTNAKEGQMSEMCNVISYISKSNKLVTDINGNNVSPEMRGVQASQEGRLDPYDTPESAQIGLVHHKTMFADTNEAGQLISPYLEVQNGRVVSEEPVMLTALEESGKYIAMWNETFQNEDGSPKQTIHVRVDGNPLSVPINKVNYKEYSPLQTMSVAHGLIPLANHSNGKRVVMGCNQSAQALPCVGIPDRPFFGTGVESIMDFGNYNAQDVLKSYVINQIQLFPGLEKFRERLNTSSLRLDGIEKLDNMREITFTVVEAEKIKEEQGIRNLDPKVQLTIPYNLKNFHDALFSFRLNHKPDRIYKHDEVLAYSLGYSLEKKEREDLVDFGGFKVKPNAFDKGLALGHNLLCGYKTFMSSTIEDSLTISDRLVHDDKLTHVRLFLIKEELHDSDDFTEEFGVLEECPEYMMYKGLPVNGTKLKPGDPVISKIRRSKHVENKQEKASGIKFSYKFLNSTQEGTVISSEIIRKDNRKEAHVLIALRASIEHGDKMAGQHGNKGVVARIVPAEQMPFDPISGRFLDICVNPLGVPSRQNVSQLLGGGVAMCRLIDGKNTYISPYHQDDLKFIKEQIEKFDVHPRMLIDGRTGKYFKRPINVVVLYMYKLQQLAVAGLHSIGMDAPVDPTLLQPRHGSKNEGGQSFGEMENWCLHGVGAYNLLNDFYGLQSDDVHSKKRFRESVLTNDPSIDAISNNSNDTMMKSLIRTLGSEIVSDQDNNSYYTKPLTDEIIKSFNAYPVESPEGLHNPIIFGRDKTRSDRACTKECWGWMDLGVEIVHPTWIEQETFARLLRLSYTQDPSKKAFPHNMSKELANRIIAGEIYVLPAEANGLFKAFAEDFAGSYKLSEVPESQRNYLRTGMGALVWMLKQLNMEAAYAKMKKSLEENFNTTNEADIKFAEYVARIQDFIEAGNKVEDFVITSFPVMPQSYRVKIDSEVLVNNIPDFDHYYIQILNAIKKVHDSSSIENIALLYNKIKELIGYGAKNDTRYKNVLNYFTGKDSDNDHGKIRSAAQSKRIFCSGRAVITPADYRIRPTELGVPIVMLVKMYHIQLIAWFAYKSSGRNPIGSIASKDWEKLFMQLALKDFDGFVNVYTDSATRFVEFYNEKTRVAFEHMTAWIVEYFEALPSCRPEGFDRPVIVSGRQPSLHKYSTRAFYPIVVWTKAIEINTLLCAGYNADFDGDKMWICAALTKAAREEALKTLGANIDFINPKNNSIMLEHTQDIVLGCYVATMLKDNAEFTDQTVKDIHYYTSAVRLEDDIFDGLIETWELVHFLHVTEDGLPRHYLSTAGRVLFNSYIFDGFTEKPFSNPLNIAGIKVERFYDLKYDGLIGKGRGSSKNLTYYNLADICMDCYNNDMRENEGTEGIDCMEQFYNIELFGFQFSDLFGVTISMDDLDLESGKEEILKEAANLRQQIEQDYLEGLISEKDKRDAILALYTDDERGTNARIMKNLIDNLPRNNNLFIMMDSGARGNKTQIMHMCGSIGVLSKSKSETMDDPVISNYYEGLTDFEVQMASYSSRVGVASTQMDTRNAGYATRKVVYMTDGTKITKQDCGKSRWWFECEWAEMRPELSRFYPSKEWLDRVGDIISADGEQATRDAVMQDGFNTLETSEGVFKADPDLLRGAKLIEGDETGEKYFSQLLDSSDCLGMDAIIAFDHYKLKSLKTSYGKLICRYKLSKRCRSELLCREARNLEFLQRHDDKEMKDHMYVITEKTLNWIEEQGLEEIEARIMLDCECHHGVCSHCYGLRLSNLRMARVGENVGTESAQSIGEPAAQLTMDVINKGGVSGASIASGIDVFSAYLNGSIAGGKGSRVADVPKRSGYARVTKIDDTVDLAVEPVDKQCVMCQACMQENENNGGTGCPLHDPEKAFDPACAVKVRTPVGMVLVKNGEWVESGDPITGYSTVGDSIVSVDDSEDPDLVLRHRQMTWVDNYFNIFHSQSININARHFELLAMVQNQNATIVASDNSDYPVGSRHKVSIIRKLPGIRYVTRTTSLQDTILSNSGLLTALTFSSQAQTIHKASFSRLSNKLDEVSPIGAISIGQNLTRMEVKDLHNSEIDTKYANFLGAKNNDPEDLISLIHVEPITAESVQSEEELLDFGDDLFGELETMDAFEETMQERREPEPQVQAEFESKSEPEPVRKQVAYETHYVFDGVEDESCTEFCLGFAGETALPDMGKVSDIYEFVPDGDYTLAEDGDVFTFYFVTVEEPIDDKIADEDSNSGNETDKVLFEQMNAF